ncbi:MAG: hypothetical protein ABIE22_00725 [archaeon]
MIKRGICAFLLVLILTSLVCAEQVREDVYIVEKTCTVATQREDCGPLHSCFDGKCIFLEIPDSDITLNALHAGVPSGIVQGKKFLISPREQQEAAKEYLDSEGYENQVEVTYVMDPLETVLTDLSNIGIAWAGSTGHGSVWGGTFAGAQKEAIRDPAGYQRFVNNAAYGAGVGTAGGLMILGGSYMAYQSVSGMAYLAYHPEIWAATSYAILSDPSNQIDIVDLASGDLATMFFAVGGLATPAGVSGRHYSEVVDAIATRTGRLPNKFIGQHAGDIPQNMRLHIIEVDLALNMRFNQGGIDPSFVLGHDLAKSNQGFDQAEKFTKWMFQQNPQTRMVLQGNGYPAKVFHSVHSNYEAHHLPRWLIDNAEDFTLLQRETIVIENIFDYMHASTQRSGNTYARAWSQYQLSPDYPKALEFLGGDTPANRAFIEAEYLEATSYLPNAREAVIWSKEMHPSFSDWIGEIRRYGELK